MAKSLVKSSSLIRSELHKRVKGLNLSLTDIVADASEKKMKISISSLSKYFHNAVTNNLSEEAIIWLCYRYGIFVTLHIGSLRIHEGKVLFQIPEYNEQRCLIILKKVFPNVRKKSRKRTMVDS